MHLPASVMLVAVMVCLLGTPARALAQAAAEPAGGPEAAAEPPVEEAPPPPLETWLDGWDGSAELGLNGTTGNEENLNFRAGFSAKRTVPDQYETSADFVYKYGKNSESTTQSEGTLTLRNDWLLEPESPWRLFALARGEYDQFQAWDWRASVFGGVGYEFIENDR